MTRLMSAWTSGPATRLLWLRRALLAALTALAAWLAVKLVLALLAPSSLWEPVLIPGSSPAVAGVAAEYDFSSNPFAAGGGDDGFEAPVDLGDDAPETTLNLQLKGLRSGDNGTAFIRTPDGQEDNHYIGDEIMSGVVLRAVFPDYVLIDVNGQTQRLTTEDAKAARSGRASTSQQTASLQTLRRVDAATFLSQVQIVPSFDADMNRNGVIVRPRSSAVDLATFGLETDDIITRFAGQSLVGGLPDIADLRRSAQSGRPVQVDIIRDGQPMTITIGSAS